MFYIFSCLVLSFLKIKVKNNLKPLFLTQKTYPPRVSSKKKDKGDESARNYELAFAEFDSVVLHINSSSFNICKRLHLFSLYCTIKFCYSQDYLVIFGQMHKYGSNYFQHQTKKRSCFITRACFATSSVSRVL